MRHQKLAQKVSRSFYLSLRILPEELRAPITLAYLLARAADAIADTDLVSSEPSKQLKALEIFLRATESGKAAHLQQVLTQQKTSAEAELLARSPVLIEELGQLNAQQLPHVRRVLHTLISGGMRSDFTHFANAKLGALPNDQALDRYTYEIAGCVGEFWSELCRDYFSEPALRWAENFSTHKEHAINYGKALQMTNILRDLPQDLRRGRCYIPQSALSRVRLKPRDLLDPKNFSRLRPIYVDYVQSTLALYSSAWAFLKSLPHSEKRIQLATYWPLAIGIKTLHLLTENKKFNPLDPTVRIRVPRAKIYKLLAESGLNIWTRTQWLEHCQHRTQESMPGLGMT